MTDQNPWAKCLFIQMEVQLPSVVKLVRSLSTWSTPKSHPTQEHLWGILCQMSCKEHISLSIYIFFYICMYVYIYIYIYIFTYL